MKKLLILLLAFGMLFPAALADGIDLSAMSFDELMELRQSLMLEIMSRPEWEETTLEAGTYYIGQDIPAGYYKAVAVNTFMEIKLYEGSREVDWYMVYGEDIGKLYLKDGWRMETNGTIILSPYAGI